MTAGGTAIRVVVEGRESVDERGARWCAAYDVLVEQGFTLASEREPVVAGPRSGFEAVLSSAP